MKNNLTEHVLNIGKEFDEKFYFGVNCVHCWGDCPDEPCRCGENDSSKKQATTIKSHLLLSQLKTIELLKEELEGTIKDHEKGMELCKSHDNITMAVSHDGSIKSLSQAITLLDTIIQNIKAQIK